MGLNRILCTVPLPGQCIIPRLDQYIVLHPDRYIKINQDKDKVNNMKKKLDVNKERIINHNLLVQYIDLLLDHYIYFLTT